MSQQINDFLNAGGVSAPCLLLYEVVPLTLQVANIAASQSPAAAALTLTAGTGTTAKTVGGLPCIQLDCPRVLRITSGGDDHLITFNVTGFDQYGVAMTEHITGANAGIATGKKAWFSIATIIGSASVTSTCSVGTGDIFGLPIYCASQISVNNVQWNVTTAQDAGTLVNGVLTTPSSITGDVRGTYAPSTGASDGTKRLIVTMNIGAAQTGSGISAAAIYGKTQA